MLDNSELEALVRRALDGDRMAVNGLVRELRGVVYSIALRMLWQPQNAEDATQEILVRVITRLGQFDFRSQFRTWVFRVAANYLLDVKKSCVERQELTFAGFAEDLERGLSDEGPRDQERSVLTEEVKIGCTLGMLQCLDRPHRLAYVLGEILDLPSPVAAEALELEPSAFRKRLQRAREALEDFTKTHCGLVSDRARCACHRRVPAAIGLGRVDPGALRFAEKGASFSEARSLMERLDQMLRVVELHRLSRPRSTPRDYARLVEDALAPRAARGTG